MKNIRSVVRRLPNSALVTDVCVAALCAFFNAAQRER